MTAKTIIARNYKAFELYSYAAIIYIVLITALTWLSKKVERRLSYDKTLGEMNYGNYRGKTFT